MKILDSYNIPNHTIHRIYFLSSIKNTLPLCSPPYSSSLSLCGKLSAYPQKALPFFGDHL